MINLIENCFENHISSINNNYIFDTDNENENSMNGDIFGIAKNISGNEIDSFDGNGYIFKSPNISENYKMNDLYETNEIKNNCNTVYGNDNNNNKLESYEKPPLIEESNLAKTSENTNLILRKRRGRKKINKSNDYEYYNESRPK